MLKRVLIGTFDKLGILGASRFLRRNHPMILMYHRIIDHPLLPGVAPSVFQAQMRYLKTKFRVIGIDQLVNELNHETLKPNTVVVTFDDGHHDFYSHAWPILRKEKIPASLYITTDFINQKNMLWPDALRYLLISSRNKELTVAGVGKFLIASDHDKLTTWNALGNYGLTLGGHERQAFLEQLKQQLNTDWNHAEREFFRPVNWQEIQEMQGEGLAVGSHTVSHPILSKTPLSELKKELAESYQIISQTTGTPPLGICYPNGMAADVSPLVVKEASSIYQYGLIAFPGGISKSKMMQLGRKAAPKTLWQFKQMVNNMSFHENTSGSYQ